MSIFTDWLFLGVLVGLLFFTHWLGNRWILEGAARAGTDILLRRAKPAAATHCSMITISEQDFDTYLGEWLEPGKLSSVLQNIIDYEPKVVVVDIDTSAPRFRDLKVPAGKSTIVWARVAHETLKNNPVDGTRTYVWQTGGILGNRPEQPAFSGSPLFPEDPDGTVRNFQRVVPTDANTPALYWAAIRAFCQNGSSDACALVKNANVDQEKTSRPFLTDWIFATIPLTDLMHPGGSTRPHAGALGEVVLLGASFSDIHGTAFGPKLGVELNASAIESELAPKTGPWRAYAWSHWLLKIVIAFVIAWLNIRLLPLWATTAMLLLLGVVFVASFLGIYYGLFRMDFLPFMIGIWIEQLIEASQHAHHAARNLE